MVRISGTKNDKLFYNWEKIFNCFELIAALKYLYKGSRSGSWNQNIPTLRSESSSYSFEENCTKFWNLKNDTKSDTCKLDVYGNL